MPHLFHWTSVGKAITALRSNRLRARRWQHYLEHEGRMAAGTSWSLDPGRWARDNPVCLVAEDGRMPNAIHRINGNRTFLLTRGMLDPLYDPGAYRLESTEPDEDFVEGTIMALDSVLEFIVIRGAGPDDTGQILALAQSLMIPVRDGLGPEASVPAGPR